MWSSIADDPGWTRVRHQPFQKAVDHVLGRWLPSALVCLEVVSHHEAARSISPDQELVLLLVLAPVILENVHSDNLEELGSVRCGCRWMQQRLPRFDAIWTLEISG